MMRNCILGFLSLGFAATSARAQTAEICGNGIDDDGDGYTDEGCYVGLTTSGLVDSPLSTADTGMVSPSTGSLYYRLPPDVAPKVPFGGDISMRRVYTSMYNPGASPPTYRKPMGDRWQHNWMSWIDITTQVRAVLHMPNGQDVYAAFDHSATCFINRTCDYYVTHGGQATAFVQHDPGNGGLFPASTMVQMLDGSRIFFDNTNKLTTMTESGGTNPLSIAYDGNGMVSTVTDASGNRRLLFGYTSSLLTTVQFQIQIASVWTTEHTTTYGYASGVLTTVTIGAQLAQTNVYTASYLTAIQDGAANTIVAFTYDDANPGRAMRVDTTRGSVGFEYNSARTGACAAKTVLYFNRGKDDTTTCSIDSDCGAGFLCGGKKGAGSTGRCYRAGRCLTVDTTAGHHEDLVTSVTSLGPPSETCDGACTDVSAYLWTNASTYVSSLGTQDPLGNYTAKAVDGNGLPTIISYGDPDSTPGNGNEARVVYITYDPTFPGRISEVDRQSSLHAASCDPIFSSNCEKTIYGWITSGNGYGKLGAVAHIGWTLAADGVTQVQFSYQTNYTYDAQNRLTQIDGPLAGSNDITVFEYWSGSGDNLKEGFLQNYKRKKDSTNFVTTSANVYDFWGNPTTLQGADTDATHSTGTMTCLTFSSARGFLSQRREAMNGQTDCSMSNALDLTTSWARDSALRLTQLTKPDGSCMFYEYGTTGRLLRSKRRDDCVSTNAGDRQEYIYDVEGLVTEIDTYDSSSVLTAKQPYAYFDSRRLQSIINPVDTSKSTGLLYDVDGQVNEIDGAGSLSKTLFNRSGLPGADHRVTSIQRYKDASLFDTWNLLYDWIGNQEKVSTDSTIAETVRDDLGRSVKTISPDMTYPTVRVYDEAGRLTTVVEAAGGGASQQTHTFTYDNLARPLNGEYQGTCPTGTSHPEIQRVYDVPATCPAGMNCDRTGGRLAYVKVSLLCSSTYVDDGSLDQETWFQYDDGGRVIREYIKDDTGRVADHQYVWNKNGALLQFTTPSTAVVGFTFDSAGSNSDKDLVTSVWRTSIATPVANVALWFPYGPLKQYNQQNKIGTKLQRTRITRNLAYRITGVFDSEPQAGGAANHSTVITEDAKGRVTERDYTPNSSPNVQDSFFLYDEQDRVLCETTALVSSCPTTGATNIKNSHKLSPPFMAPGDWKMILRPIAGTSPIGYTNDFNNSGSTYGATHQVTDVNQSDGTPAFGHTAFVYDARGNRSSDDNTTSLTHDTRAYTYDGRRNVVNVHGQYFTGGVWHDYDVANAFDARNRRVFKSFLDDVTGKQAQWFFYYDPLDRLTEVRYTPDFSVPTTYSVYQLFWLGSRLVLYWQTDNPSGTTTKRYVGSDESFRPTDMWTWPASGNGVRVWAINPSAWGFDTNLVGPTVYQPILFAGQYQDSETVAYENNGTTIHRPGLALNGFRTYDPFTGGYLQFDPLADVTWSAYVYANSNPVGSSDPAGLVSMTCHQHKQATTCTAEDLDGNNLDCADASYDQSYDCPDGESPGGNLPGNVHGHGHEEFDESTAPAGHSTHPCDSNARNAWRVCVWDCIEVDQFDFAGQLQCELDARHACAEGFSSKADAQEIEICAQQKCPYEKFAEHGSPAGPTQVHLCRKECAESIKDSNDCALDIFHTRDDQYERP